MQEVTLEQLVNECKEFTMLKNRSDNERNPAPGKAVFILSKTWLKKYKEYVFYSDVKRHNKPQMPESTRHPGPISNYEDLCIESPVYLKGTGKLENYEKTYLDVYFKPNMHERYDYKIINQELWTFLFNKYGGDEIKRYSVP
jgi:DUSP domain